MTRLKAAAFALILTLATILWSNPKLIADMQIRGSQILAHTVTILQLNTTGVTGASYGDTTHYPTYTVGADGRLTASANQTWTHNLLGAQHSDTTTGTATKGDIITSDGSTWKRFGIGADAQVLTADSTQTNGLKWATPTGGGAGGGSSAGWVPIAQVVTSASQATVTFTSIPSTYRSLSVVWSAAGNGTGTAGDNIRVLANGDTTTGDYDNTTRIGTQNTSAFTSAVTPTSAGVEVGFMPTSGDTSYNASGEVRFVNYSGTSFFKSILAVVNSHMTTGGNIVGTVGTAWKSTAAITSLTFAPADGTSTGFQAGSVFLLYGLANVSSAAATNGAMVLLESHTASSSATIDFTQFSSSFDEYVIEYQNVVPATNNVTFEMLMSTNGGISYDTTAGHYKYASYLSADTGAFSTNTIGSNSAAFIALALNLSNTAADGWSGSSKLFNPQQTSSNHPITADFTFLNNDTNRYRGMMSGFFAQTTAYNAVRFVMSSGNIASGTFRLYGISPTIGAGASAAGKILLEQYTVSGASEIDFTSCISSAYDSYEVNLVGMTVSTNTATIRAQVSTNGGASYDTISGHYSWELFAMAFNASAANGSTSDTAMTVFTSLSNAAPATANATLQFENPASTTAYRNFRGNLAFTDSSRTTDSLGGAWVGKYVTTGTAVNAFRFIPSTGTLSGTARCYGMGK